MNIKIKNIDIDPAKIRESRGLGNSHAAQIKIATQFVRLADPYVPKSAGAAPHMKSQYKIAPDGSYVKYPGPYAHYQYVGLVMVGPAPKVYTNRPLKYHEGPTRGKEWDKRMMADKKSDLIKAAAAAVGGKPK